MGGAKLVSTERTLSEERWSDLSDYHLIDGKRPYGDETCVCFLENQRKLKKPIPIKGSPSGNQWAAHNMVLNDDLWQRKEGINLHEWEPFYMKVEYQNSRVYVFRPLQEDLCVPLEWEE